MEHFALGSADNSHDDGYVCFLRILLCQVLILSLVACTVFARSIIFRSLIPEISVLFRIERNEAMYWPKDLSSSPTKSAYFSTENFFVCSKRESNSLVDLNGALVVS